MSLGLGNGNGGGGGGLDSLPQRDWVGLANNQHVKTNGTIIMMTT